MSAVGGDTQLPLAGEPRTAGDVAPGLRPPLALADGPPRERADAARNRRRILAAAEALVAERGIEKVSMEDVACAAGVGTGTLYRRFRDRAGLALALLDESTRAFQDALIAGPPPLGPGAPAAERLRAFGQGYFDLLERHADLLVVAVPPGGGADGPAVFFATHLAILVREAAPHLDAEFTARALLAMLAPGEYLHARRRLGWSRERLAEGWRGVVDAMCREPGAGR
jgi:AcrR family transcriptional regulator